MVRDETLFVGQDARVPDVRHSSTKGWWDPLWHSAQEPTPSGIGVDIARGCGGQHPDGPAGCGGVRHLDVIHPRPVTALALHVVVGGVLDHVPPGSRLTVPVLAHRVAAVAEVLRARAVHQAGVGISVGRGHPVVLVTDVAVAASGRFVAAGEIAEESRAESGGGLNGSRKTIFSSVQPREGGRRIR